MEISPRFDRKTTQFSDKLGFSLLANVTLLIFLTLAPSWAVNLYLPLGFRFGSRKILNCSSLAINTLWGAEYSPCSPEKYHVLIPGSVADFNYIIQHKEKKTKKNTIYGKIRIQGPKNPR